MIGGSYRYDSVLPAVHAYGFFLRYRAIKDIAQITSYRDAIGAPCIRALGPAWIRIARDRRLWRQFREGFLLTE